MTKAGCRKTWESQAASDLGMPDSTFLDSTELVLNMGPQHPSTHGVLRVILKLDGEKVLGTECIIGYLHRGVEKIAEHRTYAQFNPYVDRMDYVAAISNGLGFRSEGRGNRVHHRLSASRRGEDCRAPHLRAVQSLRGPHGLRGGHLQRTGLLPGGGETAQRDRK